jgi:hypothetical protein
LNIFKDFNRLILYFFIAVENQVFRFLYKTIKLSNFETFKLTRTSSFQ